VLAVAIRAISLPFVVGFTWAPVAQEKSPGRDTIVRDAKTEASLRKFADPCSARSGWIPVRSAAS